MPKSEFVWFKTADFKPNVWNPNDIGHPLFQGLSHVLPIACNPLSLLPPQKKFRPYSNSDRWIWSALPIELAGPGGRLIYIYSGMSDDQKLLGLKLFGCRAFFSVWKPNYGIGPNDFHSVLYIRDQTERLNKPNSPNVWNPNVWKPNTKKFGFRHCLDFGRSDFSIPLYLSSRLVQHASVMAFWEVTF